MKAEQNTEKIMDWIEGRLSAEEVAAFEAEMLENIELADECETTTAIVAYLHDLDVDFEPSADFHQDLMTRLSLEEGQTERKPVEMMSEEKTGKNEKLYRWLDNFVEAFRRRPVLYGTVATCCLVVAAAILTNGFGWSPSDRMNGMTGSAQSAGSGSSASWSSSAPAAPPPGSIMPEFGVMYDEADNNTVMDSGGRGESYEAERIKEIAREDMANSTATAGGAPVSREPEQSSQAPAEQKIIRTGYVSLEVERFDEAAAAIKSAAAALGGYVTQENRYIIDGRERKAGHITVKIPFDQYDRLTEQAEGLGKVLDSNVRAEDVTAQFVDLRARIEVYETKHDRLLALLEQSGDLPTILAIENELASTSADLESLKGQMRYLQSRTDFSTLEISLTERAIETVVIQTTGFGGFVERVQRAFIYGVNGVIRSFGDLIVWLARNLAGLTILALVFGLCWKLWLKRWWARRKED